jgi:hypothetical protein
MSDGYKFSTKQELIKRAQVCDRIAAQRRPNDPHYIKFRQWAYNYRRAARERKS